MESTSDIVITALIVLVIIAGIYGADWLWPEPKKLIQKPFLVGLIGTQGIDTLPLAELFLSNGFKCDYFSKPLLTAASSLFQLSFNQVYGGLQDVIDTRLKSTPKQLIDQLKGVVLPKESGMQELWDGSIQKKISARLENLVICDVETFYQADMIRDHGGILIRIQKPSTDDLKEESKKAERDDLVSDMLLIHDGSEKSLAEQFHSQIVQTPILHLRLNKKKKRTGKAD